MIRLPIFLTLLFTLLLTLVDLFPGLESTTTAAIGVASARTTAKPTALGKHRDITAAKRFPTADQPLHSSPTIQKAISARSAIIIDADSGRVLFAKSPDTPRQPASTIKVLTGIIAIKSLQPDEYVPVSAKAAGQPSSKMHLKSDRFYSANELINAVLIASANDASVALAEMIAGSESSFAQMMTLRAELWGARHTVCKTANGLTAEGQTSSARDLAIIFRQAMKNEDFAARMKQRRMQTSDGAMLYNHNKALWRMKGTKGGKTGYTYAARQTYVGKFQRGSKGIIIAVLASETMWHDVKRLVTHGFSLAQYLPPSGMHQPITTITTEVLPL